MTILSIRNEHILQGNGFCSLVLRKVFLQDHNSGWADPFQGRLASFPRTLGRKRNKLDLFFAVHLPAFAISEKVPDG